MGLVRETQLLVGRLPVGGQIGLISKGSSCEGTVGEDRGAVVAQYYK